MKTFKYVVIIASIVVFIGGIGFCLWFAGTYPVTNSESLFLGVFVSLLSILASWLVSHIYAELSVQSAREDARANLRTYALKAAEKVTNLSNELSKLAGYLQAELDETSYSTTELDLQGKNERIQSAIHLLFTLKSVNDGSLSDWEGVIGDELKDQRQREEDVIEEQLSELGDRVDELSTAVAGGRESKDIDNLRREIRAYMFQVAGNTRGVLPAPKPRKLKETVNQPCPACEETIIYKQKPSETSFKGTKCANCKAEFISHYDSARSSFVLEPRQMVTEQLTCPYCATRVKVVVDNMPGTAATIPCSSCRLRMRVSRDLARGLKGTALPNELAKVPPAPLTDEILSNVTKALPEQPWPHGIHKKVASDLELSEATVNAAIDELIRLGKFHFQHAGKLFKEISPASDTGKKIEQSINGAVASQGNGDTNRESKSQSEKQ